MPALASSQLPFDGTAGHRRGRDILGASTADANEALARPPVCTGPAVSRVSKLSSAHASSSASIKAGPGGSPFKPASINTSAKSDCDSTPGDAVRQVSAIQPPRPGPGRERWTADQAF